MRTCRFTGLMVIVAFVLFTASGASGQTATTGQILGDITDPSGGVVGGAKVVLTSDAGAQRDTVTSSAGRYAFSLLPPGKDSVEITASGFALARVDEVIVKITATTVVDVRLALASQQHETVTVQATPPLVQTESPSHGTVIEQTEIRQLPLPTRNFQQLLTLTPGTSGPVQNSSELAAAPRRSTSMDSAPRRTPSSSTGSMRIPLAPAPLQILQCRPRILCRSLSCKPASTMPRRDASLVAS